MVPPQGGEIFMKLNEIKAKLIKLAGFTVIGAAFLWGLWRFGLSDSMTQGMSATAAHTLEVFVAVGITVLALIGPAFLLKKMMEEGPVQEGQTEEPTSRYQRIVEKSNNIILEIDEEGKIIFANPAVILLGYEPDSLLGKPIKDLFQEGDQEKALPRVTTRRIGPRATINFPVTLLTNDDSVLSYEEPSMEFLVDAAGLWKEPDEVVRIKGSEKTFLGTLIIARTRSGG